MRTLTRVGSIEATVAGEKNNREIMATLLRMLAELRTIGRRMDQQFERMNRRLESLEAWRREHRARLRCDDGGQRSTSSILDDAAQTLSKIDLRGRKRGR